MAFGNISTLYVPTSANAGASQWGSDVRKLLDAADAGSDATTITDHGTGGAVTRTVDPYTTKATDDTQADFGWAVAPSDMNSVSGALRFYPAGNHVLTVRYGHNGATGATGTLTMFAYRVGPSPTRTRTLLGSNTGSVVLPAASGEVTATVTLALGEIIFAVDETIQYSFELNLAGIIAVGRTATFFAGTQSAVQTRVATPRLGVLADTTGTASGSGTASGVTGKVLGTIGSVSGSGTASGVGASRADTTGTASGSGTASGVGASRADTTGTASGAASVSGVMGKVLGTVGTVDIGGCPEDFAGSDPSKEITGTVYDSAGAPAAGATVKLFRQSDDLQVGSTTTAGDGTYSFVRDAADPNTYYAVSYSDSTHHGTTDRDLAPV